MNVRLKAAIVCGAILVAAGAVAGCGGGGGEAGSDTSAPAATSGGTPQNAVLAALPSPGQLDPQTHAYPGPANTFVGEIEGTSFFLGVSIVDGQAAGYICNGEIPDVVADDAVATEAAFEAANEDAIAPWLTGSVDGETVSLAADGNPATFEGTVAGDTLSGTVTLPDGTSHEVSLAKVSGTTSDGLYRSVTSAENVKLVGGWVFVDGEIRGRQTIQEIGSAIVEGAEFLGDCTRLASNMSTWHSIWTNYDAQGNHEDAVFALGILQKRAGTFEEMGCPDGLVGLDPGLLEDAGELLP